MKRCPACAEEIQDAAIICRFCRTDLSRFQPGGDGGTMSGSVEVRVTHGTTSGYAIASLVLGIVWIYGVTSILALVFGYQAIRQIDDSKGTLAGRGMAIAGVVLGWVGVGLMTLALIALAAGGFRRGWF